MPNLPMLPYKQKKKKKKSSYSPSEKKLKFIVISSGGDLLSLAFWLSKVEKYDVLLHVISPKFDKVGEGIIEKEKTWVKCIGKGYIWIFEDCDQSELQDWLRDQGEYVVGSNTKMAELESNRQMGQEWFKEIGYPQPESHNFTDIQEAKKFVEEHTDKKWILKQNGEAPKSTNHKGKFDSGEDMIMHLDELEKSWNQHEYGEFDCDLMEIVDGVECAATIFFNGHDFMRNKQGKVIGFLNFEEKKEIDGNRGETTGETGTTFLGVDEDNEMFKEIIMHDSIEKKLKETGYKGAFDINGSFTDKGYIAFEATSRFGIPTTSYVFTQGVKNNTGEMLAAMAMGEDRPIEIQMGVGMVIIVAAKPYPLIADIENSATSIGQKLWIMKDGKPIRDFTEEQLQRIHPENFEKTEEGDYRVASKDGYLLTVTGIGKEVEEVREDIIDFIEENIYIAGMKFRTDIGERVEGII